VKRLVLVLLAAALVCVLAPAAALAKGASEAEILGPGLDEPISLAGEGQPGGEQLMQIAEAAGFFPAVFAQSPDPMLAEQPAGTLGPKYTITYVMPGPNNELDQLVQNIYPYAEPNPVSYTEPGQRFWSTERTRGGWFVATPFVKDELVALGLPQTPPPLNPESTEFPWTLVGVLAVAGALLGLAALTVLLIRRRPRPATTA
jgi:hypothetical protein